MPGVPFEVRDVDPVGRKDRVEPDDAGPDVPRPVRGAGRHDHDVTRPDVDVAVKAGVYRTAKRGRRSAESMTDWAIQLTAQMITTVPT